MSKLGELMVELRQVAQQGDPARCAEPMSGITRQVDGLRSEAEFNGLRLTIDEPEIFGGTGPTAAPSTSSMESCGRVIVKASIKSGGCALARLTS